MSSFVVGRAVVVRIPLAEVLPATLSFDDAVQTMPISSSDAAIPIIRVCS